MLVRLYEAAGVGTDHVSVCQCLMFLDDAPAVAALLTKLIEGSEARAGAARGAAPTLVPLFTPPARFRTTR